MDGSHITEVRTAAVSAVAARHLAGAPCGALAIFGCGVQAGSHVRTLAATVPRSKRCASGAPVGEPAGVRRRDAAAGPRAAGDRGERASGR